MVIFAILGFCLFSSNTADPVSTLHTHTHTHMLKLTCHSRSSSLDQFSSASALSFSYLTMDAHQWSGLFVLFFPVLSSAPHSVCLGVCSWLGILMSATVLLGATLGTVSGVLTLCGLSLLCKSCKKGKLERGDDTDPEKAKPSILHTLTQVRVKPTHAHWPAAYLNTEKCKS